MQQLLSKTGQGQVWSSSQMRIVFLCRSQFFASLEPGLLSSLSHFTDLLSESLPLFSGSHLLPWFSSETLSPWTPLPSLASPHQSEALPTVSSAARSPPEGWSPPLDHWPQVKISRELCKPHLNTSLPETVRPCQKTLLCTQYSLHLDNEIYSWPFLWSVCAHNH